MIFIFLTIIAMISSVLLIFAVLLQKSKKEGGLDPMASSTTQLMGVTNTTNLLEKVTWGFAFTIALCSIGSTFYLKRNMNRKFVFSSPNIRVAQERDMYGNQGYSHKSSNKEKNK